MQAVHRRHRPDPSSADRHRPARLDPEHALGVHPERGDLLDDRGGDDDAGSAGTLRDEPAGRAVEMIQVLVGDQQQVDEVERLRMIGWWHEPVGVLTEVGIDQDREAGPLEREARLAHPEQRDRARRRLNPPKPLREAVVRSSHGPSPRLARAATPRRLSPGGDATPRRTG